MKYFFLITFLFFTNCRYLPPIGEKYKKPETKMPAAAREAWASLEALVAAETWPGLVGDGLVLPVAFAR